MMQRGPDAIVVPIGRREAIHLMGGFVSFMAVFFAIGNRPLSLTAPLLLHHALRVDTLGTVCYHLARMSETSKQLSLTRAASLTQGRLKNQVLISSGFRPLEERE